MLKTPELRTTPAGEFVGFVSDKDTADTLGQALTPAFPAGVKLHIADFRTSLTLLANMELPKAVLVDITGEDQPITAMMKLSEVITPDTTVFIIGEFSDVSSYRIFIKDFGIKDYFVKPLSTAAIQKCFIAFTAAKAGEEVPGGISRAGRIIAVSGMRGGVGASTIASNLAWVIGKEMHRHTLLLDTDLYTGTAALNFHAKSNKGLSQALAAPERVDSLLIERSTQHVTPRLHILSSDIPLMENSAYIRTSADSLARTLGQRYKFIIADIGAKLLPFARDLLYLTHRRIIILDPSFVSIRNLSRFMAMPANPQQSAEPILVLNQAGRPGGLSQSKMENTLGMKFDHVIPDLPKIVPVATLLGKPAAEPTGPFRTAIGQLANAIGARADELGLGSVAAK
jgi:pilus assembly protein CpaE